MADVSGISKAQWRQRLAGLAPRTLRMVEEVAAGIDRRQFADARRALVGALVLAPLHPEVLRLQGVLSHLDGRYTEAVTTLREALATKPDDALIMNNLGSALRASGDVDAAIQMFMQATSLAPTLTGAWFNLGKTLKSQARLAEARMALETALELSSAHVPARIVLGNTLLALGEIEASAQAFREALRHNPRAAQAWFSLANLKTIPITPEETTRLRQIHKDAALGEADRILIGFALAKALEDAGLYAESFAVLRDANQRKRRQQPWDAVGFSASIDLILDNCAHQLPTSADPAQGHEVIFIVSMPRSGSSLVEQILAAHADVEGASELDALPAVIEAESKRRGVALPLWFAQATVEDWSRLGREYLELTSRWRVDRPRFTDKGLSNWRLVAAALAMLPAARIVICRRDPLETCLSCFAQSFEHGQEFTYSINDLAAYWKDFDRLRRHWLELYPDRVYDMVYENLVADPHASIRDLLAFCDLPFDPACLRFHEVRRHVRTASAAQVLQPLKSNTARGDRYGSVLDELRRALR